MLSLNLRSLPETAFRRLKRPPICINLPFRLKAAVALRHTEFLRLSAVSATQCLVWALVLLRGTVMILPLAHLCRSPTACQVWFTLLKPKFSKVVAGRSQFTIPIRVRCTQLADLLNLRLLTTVSGTHGLQAGPLSVSCPVLGAHHLNSWPQFLEASFLVR
jgi:hypothetical protein